MIEPKVIDLRSDTVTLPTPEMRRAMSEAEVGDDVYGEDPTIAELERTAARALGKKAALFVTSGTQSNLIALLSHCERGDAFIAGRTMHTYLYEGGGASVLGGIHSQPLDEEEDGSLDLERVRAEVLPDDSHHAVSRLLCLENTHHGRPLGPAYLSSALALAAEVGLATHLDGARLFNAATALEVPVRELASGFDTVSICLSKGLGAPVGSVLCGTESMIQRAHRWRKVVGGGMRQAGILAAAGLVALSGGVLRLGEDHENARRLAAALEGIAEVEVLSQATNMVFIRVPERHHQALRDHLERLGVRISSSSKRIRLVTHRDVSSAAVDRTVDAFVDYFTSRS